MTFFAFPKGVILKRENSSEEVVFENSPSDHETWFIGCYVSIHVDFTSILHLHTPLVPQAYCEVNVDRLHLFHQWECLNCNGHGLSVSGGKWPSTSRTWWSSCIPYVPELNLRAQNGNFTACQTWNTKDPMGDWRSLTWIPAPAS